MRPSLQQPLHCAAASLALSALLAACSPSPPPPSRQSAPAPGASTVSGDGPQISIGVTVGVPSNPQGFATALPAAKPAGTAPPAQPAAPAPASNRAEATFRFREPLPSADALEEISAILKRNPAVLDVTGDEETITVAFDPAQHSPDRLRDVLSGTQHPVQP